MANLEIIKDKISILGGVARSPLCKESADHQFDKSLIEDLEKMIGGAIPGSYIEMCQLYGPFIFQEGVRIRCKDKNPVADNKNNVSVNFFYGILRNGECSILKLYSTYSEQIPEHFLPVCDGVAGDLICIDLSGNNYGRIYYWYHEGNPGQDAFLIADSFIGFISALERGEVGEETSDDVEAEFKLSDKMLEMLRKSGFGPKTT